MRKKLFIALICILIAGSLVGVKINRTSWIESVKSDLSKVPNVQITGTSQVDAGGSSGNQLLYITLRPKSASAKISILERSAIASMIQNGWKKSAYNVLVKDSIAGEVWTCEDVHKMLASDHTMKLYTPISVIQFCHSTYGLVVSALQI